MKSNNLFFKMTAKKYAFISVFFWATAFVFTKMLLKTVDVRTLAVTRYSFATIILIGLAIKRKMKFPAIKDLPIFFITGLCGFSAYVLIFNYSSTLINPATASVITSLTPAVTAIAAYIFLKEKISLFGWVGLLISFIGILILTLWNGVLLINKGVLYMLFDTVLFATYNIAQRKLNKKYNYFDIVTCNIISGGIQLILISPNSLGNILNISLGNILLILYLAIFPSILAYVFWTKAFSLCKNTTEVTAFMFISPIITAILGFIFIGDIPHISTFIGGAIIILGMVIFNKVK